jgi:hypothetical protein
MKEKRISNINLLPSGYQCISFTEDGKKVPEHVYPLKAQLIKGKRRYDERYEVKCNLNLGGETL